MNSERRTHARRLLYSPEYLDMGADNGGVVVNLSEGGLAFQAVGPVVPEAEIPLSFSLGPGYRIDVKARVVWVNAEGKLGGAVFGKLSKDSLSLIREWLAKPAVEHDVESVLVAPVADREAEGAMVESALPVSPPSSVASQMTDALFADETVAGNGSVLSSHDTKSAAEASPTVSFPHHEITSPPMPASGVAAQEPLSPAPPSRRPVAETRRQEIPITPSAPTRTPPKREQATGASYSGAPSIAAWGRNESHPTRHAPAMGSSGPTFPLRSTENLFARSSSRAEHERRGRSGALAIFAIVIAAGAVVAFYARTHRQQIGSEISHIGNTIAGEPASSNTTATPQTSPVTANPAATPSQSGNATALPGKPVQAPTQAPAAPSAREQSADHSKTSVTQKPNIPTTTPPTQAAHSSDGNTLPGASNTQTPTKNQGAVNPSKSTSANTSVESPALGQAEYQRAENYLNGRGVSQDSAQAAEWFWRSLEAGNTSAAIPLADLYLAGNGVSRSCTQARILLDAAAAKNDPTAIKKLSELPESCH